jgi:hypothetical protein
MKEYPARCHVCGVLHIVKALFISGSQYADGRLRLSCGAHTGEEIRKAWLAR